MDCDRKQFEQFVQLGSLYRCLKILFGVQAYGLRDSSLEDLKLVPATIRELVLGTDQQPGLFVDALSRFTSLTSFALSGKLTDLEFARFPKLFALSLCYLPKLELKSLLEQKNLKSLRVHHASIMMHFECEGCFQAFRSLTCRKSQIWKIWIGSLHSRILVASKSAVFPKFNRFKN